MPWKSLVKVAQTHGKKDPKRKTFAFDVGFTTSRSLQRASDSQRGCPEPVLHKGTMEEPVREAFHVMTLYAEHDGLGVLADDESFITLDPVMNHYRRHRRMILYSRIPQKPVKWFQHPDAG